jgi:peptidoglycan hydrolase-like protein with peptidoglycan-binding domain
MAELSRGNSGPAVSNLQMTLVALGFSPGAIDGKFGVYTEQAVRQFQSQIGVMVSGTFDDRTSMATRGILKAVANGRIPAQTPQASRTAVLSLLSKARTVAKGARSTVANESLGEAAYHPGETPTPEQIRSDRRNRRFTRTGAEVPAPGTPSKLPQRVGVTGSGIQSSGGSRRTLLIAGGIIAGVVGLGIVLRTTGVLGAPAFEDFEDIDGLGG